MFAPPGFFTLGDMAGFCDDLSTAIWSARRLREHERGNLPAGERAKEAFFERELLSAWLVSKSLNTRPTYMCSPSGEYLVAGYLLKLHEDRLDWYDWTWPIAENDELSGPLHRALAKDDMAHFITRFRFIDYVTGTVCVSERLSDIHNLATDTDEDIKIQLAVASQFDGWAICFRPEDFPDDYEQFLHQIDFQAERVVSSSPLPQSRRLGRPPLQNLARSAYSSAFPDGHGGTPWKVVEDRVAEFAGRRISAKTIQRAIGQNDDNIDNTPDKN